MKKIKTLGGLAILLFLTAGILAAVSSVQKPQTITPKAAAATKISISPVTQNVSPGDNFSFSVKMDTGVNQIIGVDLLLKFDPSVIQIASLQKGSDISAMTNTITNKFDNTAGTISYVTFTVDKTKAVSGSAVEALKVNARIKSQVTLGSQLITFDSSTAISATGETQNALTDEIPGIVVVVAQSTPTSTPTASPTPTPAAGAPNSCGGTCGSNSNCGANLYCYQGYCRNPSCSWSTDCSCTTPTGTPIPTSVSTIKPKVTGTVSKNTPTPSATTNNFWQTIFNGATATPIALATLTPSGFAAQKSFNFLPWIIGALIVAGISIILIIIGMSRVNKPKPPVIGI